MIPVGLPSVEWMLLVGALLGSLLIWAGWTLLLILRPKKRKSLTRNQGILYLLFSIAAVFTLYKIIQINWALRMFPYYASQGRQNVVVLPAPLMWLVFCPIAKDQRHSASLPMTAPCHAKTGKSHETTTDSSRTTLQAK